jgi:hypothetical protein
VKVAQLTFRVLDKTDHHHRGGTGSGTDDGLNDHPLDNGWFKRDSS